MPPYYLPLFAQWLGLSSSTSSILVVAFKLCNAIGRFAGGSLCDKLGPVNTFLATMVLNAVAMLAIWPLSRSLAPLVIFAILNGVDNGSRFSVLLVVVATIFGLGRAEVAMSMSIIGFTVGYLMEAPIAGYLLQVGMSTASPGERGDKPYQPTIF